MKVITEHINKNESGESYLRLDALGKGIKLSPKYAEIISQMLIAEARRIADKHIDFLLGSINCHKFVLYCEGLISKEELYSHPSDASQDFTYREKALALSDQDFILITDINELKVLANKYCMDEQLCIGQILDAVDGKLAHSFLVGKESVTNRFISIDKIGFKHHPFSVQELSTFLDRTNKDGEKNYQNQKWRFLLAH